jgi:hypothetical protein
LLRRKEARGKRIPSVRLGGSPDEINASTAKTTVITERQVATHATRLRRQIKERSVTFPQ